MTTKEELYEIHKEKEHLVNTVPRGKFRLIAIDEFDLDGWWCVGDFSTPWKSKKYYEPCGELYDDQGNFINECDIKPPWYLKVSSWWLSHTKTDELGRAEISQHGIKIQTCEYNWFILWVHRHLIRFSLQDTM